MASSRSDARLRRAFLAVLVASLAVLALNCESLAPQEGWSKRWGPLVPHRSFPGDCGICHVPERWDVLRPDFSFDHRKETGFALEGAHASASCLRCHNDRGPVRVYLERGCGGCHADFHGGKLGPDCTRCHDQLTWRPGGLVAEHSSTRFPLFGAHAATPCEQCHERAPSGDFQNAPVRCEQCHRQDLARATSPDHRASGWTERCERCHTPSTWSRSDFTHDSFPLAGGHAGLDCTRCHVSGTFSRIPSDCYSCHQDDYEAAPQHVALGYPRDCTQCHTIYSFSASAQNHRFPLRGPHDEPCATCHTASFASFNCLVCHEHSRAEMDDKHDEVNGYSYSSAACYRCHPDGNE